MEKLLLTDKNSVKGRALFLGERLELKPLERTNFLATMPLVIQAGDRGCAVIFATEPPWCLDLIRSKKLRF